MKQNKLKEIIIKELKEMPIIQFACKKTGVSRATYYRWRNESKKFAKEADRALTEGEAFITDMSESQLVQLIKDRNFQAIQLWLRHHHLKYTNKVELTGNLNVKEEPLTEKQKELVEKSLRMAGLLENKDPKKNE